MKIKLRALMITLIGISACSQTMPEAPVEKAFSCEYHNWDSVLKMVGPYMNDFEYTALVMQGLSSGYNTSIAAQQAKKDGLPSAVLNTLNNILKNQCK
jgi:hypothetical protein